MRIGAKTVLAWGAVLGAAALAGACPLPQPLPGVGTVDAGTLNAPPFVYVPSAQPALPVTYYGPPSACDGGAGAGFVVSADVIDYDTSEVDEARWFVDYDPTTGPGISLVPGTPITLLPPTNTSQIVRTNASPFTSGYFYPSSYDTPSPRTHVVLMAVSNGFQGISTEPSLDGGMPNLEPQTGYQVQVFRWTFVPEADGGCGP